MTVNLAEYLHPDGIATRVRATNKQQVLELLAKLLAQGNPDHLSAEQILNGLILREFLGGTNLGEGISLPHSRMPNAQRIVAAFLQLARGINCDAADKKQVDLFFALVVPEQNADDLHLSILSHLAQIFSDPQACARLRNTVSPAELYQIITTWQPK